VRASAVRAAGLGAALLVAACVLSGCASEGATTDPGAPPAAGPVTGSSAEDSVAAAAALVQQRYEFVRDGDYDAACALYSNDYAELFAELADAVGESCVDAHTKAAQNAADYIATAADQGRAGLTPFFFVPSAIEVDASAIVSDEPGLAFLGEGTVVSLDATQFEDGTGLTPGWLAGQDYVKQAADGSWLFISPLEQ